ncbi:MAG: sugar ABC transporter permease [Candidatus Thermofonsia Clade 1 bacterium]|jgi:multiple sugar transport system permease protein|uniref:Sugar ABC transporter permease n=1 Tax=Candidatus Thermofonsia Clade 1 bacterium TaxID=2364210 RepID=A0A2M8Q0I8_9CHLR|nr:MAG: sugar ABC transporter permease [Candidatus Thermofonsia Clade 1 bacterium]PJF43298.1 MAG: sugar ABC transporter permease [Candidatus Thermofonsia Clade 1 bacterium]RMF52203.1 MAG: sugar ABC transporter permease [Chloroflexota bacterium]
MTSVPTPISTNPIALRTRRQASIYEQQRRWGWIFLSPWLIGFFAFTFIPIVASLIFSFTDFTLTRPDRISFVGLNNWLKLFNDPLALNALRVTIGFALLSLPVAIALPVLLAALLNSKYLLGKPFFRLLFYLPYMVPAISGIFIWQAFLNGQTGWLNRLLRLMGISEPPNWLGNEFWIGPAMVLMGVWGVGNAMLITLATLQGVPQELYDAAKVDGADAVKAFFKITLPMISPVIFYNLILSVIGLLQYFVVPYVLTRGTGNPNGAAYFFNMHLYRTAFLFQDMGYGATMAWFIFLIAIVLTIILFATSRRWVYYAGGE